MSQHIVLDVRNLDAAMMRARIAGAIGRFAAGDTLKVLTDRDPQVLYPMLERGGFRHHDEPGAVSDHELTIWPAGS